MKRLLILLLLLIPALAQAQTTTVTGVVVDANGNAYFPGTVSAAISLNTGQALPAGVPASGSIGPFATTPNGNFSVTVASPFSWTFTICGTPKSIGPLGNSTPTQVCFTTAAIAISGASQVITSNLPTIPLLGSTGGSSIACIGSLCTPGVTSVPVQNGLIAEYRILPTESPASLIDYSGNGNNATGTVGTAPTIQAITGGINCTGNGAVILPAALNSARTIIAYVTYQPSGSQLFNSIVAGNFSSGGTPANSAALSFINTTPARGQAQLQASNTTGSQSTTTYGSPLGTNVVGVAMDTVDHLYINGVEAPDYTNTGTISGAQSAGQYQICGAASLSGFFIPTYLTGQVYYLAMWNVVLNAAQMRQASNYVSQTMTVRGVPVQSQTNATTNAAICNGDSITAGNTPNPPVATPFCLAMTLVNGTWTSIVNAFPGRLALTEAQGAAFDTDPLVRRPTVSSGALGRTIGLFFLGTNDIAGAASAQSVVEYASNWCQGRRKNAPSVGWSALLLGTTIDRTGISAAVESLDQLERQYWPRCFDGLVDFQSDPTLGASGANATAAFQSDHIHPTQGTQYNHMVPIAQRAFNMVYGNRSWSAANTYTATTPAAVAVSAASESGNTMTFTTAANTFVVGNCVVVAGVTPAGYNSTTNSCWLVLTAPNNTTFTAYNDTTGLTALTVAGTASTSQEVDIDIYAILGGSAAGPIHVLESCQGRTDQPIYRMITNTNASPWIIKPFYPAETINGGATYTAPVATASNQQVVVLKPILVSASASGCTWSASIQ